MFLHKFIILRYVFYQKKKRKLENRTSVRNGIRGFSEANMCILCPALHCVCLCLLNFEWCEHEQKNAELGIDAFQTDHKQNIFAYFVFFFFSIFRNERRKTAKKRNNSLMLDGNVVVCSIVIGSKDAVVHAK